MINFFVEKTKFADNLYVENLNHLSWNKSPTNYVQQVILKITKESNCSKSELFIDVGRILKGSVVCWRNKILKQFVCKKIDFKWQYIYKYYFKVIYSLVFTCHKQIESLEIQVYAPYLGEFRFWSNYKV